MHLVDDPIIYSSSPKIKTLHNMVRFAFVERILLIKLWGRISKGGGQWSTLSFDRESQSLGLSCSSAICIGAGSGDTASLEQRNYTVPAAQRTPNMGIWQQPEGDRWMVGPGARSQSAAPVGGPLPRYPH